jgi:hypothetical protein
VNFTATAANSGGATVVMLNAFAGAQTTAGSLNDGRYVLTVLASQVAANGFQLDGDGDGTGGDNYVLSDSGQPGGLYRFFGDVTGDRFVNGADFDFFRTAFGTLSGQPNFLAAFDVNGDGIINGADFAPFRGNFGLSL